MSTKYALVSLPRGIFDSSQKTDAIDSLRTTISLDYGVVRAFNVPDFKIATLDTLVQQADNLAKLESNCRIVVAKVADSLKSILDGDEDRITQQKLVNDKPIDQYVSSFSWNKVRYRTDKPLNELVDILQKELMTTDNDVRSKFNQYNSVKTSFLTLKRRQTGNLATKSLTPLVTPEFLIQGSEYLETHLIVIPIGAKNSFLRSYETLTPMVVPRSAIQVSSDEDFILFTTTVFKKYSNEFLQKCREQKWSPRQYEYVEGGKEDEQREVDHVAREEKKMWGEALRIGRTAWSESVMIWLHVLALRMFVEAVLRYGLPLDYVNILVKTNSKLVKKIKSTLDTSYSFLGGNAFGRDKSGQITKDGTTSSELAVAVMGGDEGHEYTAYVYYEFDFP